MFDHFSHRLCPQVSILCLLSDGIKLSEVWGAGNVGVSFIMKGVFEAIFGGFGNLRYLVDYPLDSQ